MARGDKKKKKKVVTELTPAERFVQLQTLKKAVRCLLVDEDVYVIYEKLSRDFAELDALGRETPFEGWEECAALHEECEQLAAEWKKKLPNKKVEDSRTVMTTTREQEETGALKKGKGKWIFLGIVVVIALFVVSYRIPTTRYSIARVADALGIDSVAKSSYHALGDYKDAKERFVNLEKEQIAKVRIGKAFTFGSSKWMVLKRQDGKALLAQYETDSSYTFHDVSADVTWESCSLRRYLNGEFLTTFFTDEERAIIEQTSLSNPSNDKYGTDGGSDTVDQVFILSETEYAVYKKKLGDKGRNMRLRTPGKDNSSTAFVSGLKDVVSYGFPVEERGAVVRPMMWVRYE